MFPIELFFYNKNALCPQLTSSLKPASSGSSWRVSSSERISRISQSTNILSAWHSLQVWCFPSRNVLWPALPALNICLLHDTVGGHGGKPLDSAVYNGNTRALYQLITAECISVAWTNVGPGNLSAGLSISLTFTADLLHISSSFISICP